MAREHLRLKVRLQSDPGPHQLYKHLEGSTKRARRYSGMRQHIQSKSIILLALISCRTPPLDLSKMSVYSVPVIVNFLCTFE